MLSFKQFIEFDDFENDSNGRKQVSMASSGADTVKDGTPVKARLLKFRDKLRMKKLQNKK